VLTPLKVNVPAFAFSKEPVPDTTPAYNPDVTVNAVPFKVNKPPEPPPKDCRTTAEDAIDTVPSTPNAVVEGIIAPLANVNVPPPITEIAVDTKEPVPVSVIDPDRTVVAPENVFAPLSVKAPTPTFSKDPVPLKTPA
jgi:hypothetical protein